MNINHFNDLPPTIQEELLKYIHESFTDGKKQHTAYSLKQPFSRIHPHEDYHVTTRCFMEAMVHMGYEAVPIPGCKEPDWYFRVNILHN